MVMESLTMSINVQARPPVNKSMHMVAVTSHSKMRMAMVFWTIMMHVFRHPTKPFKMKILAMNLTVSLDVGLVTMTMMMFVMILLGWFWEPLRTSRRARCF